MKILFVSRVNNKNEISPIIKNQGDSLSKIGMTLTYFPIQGKGVLGYIKSIPRLKKYLKDTSHDIIHAHYSLSAFVATFAGARPLVVSLMGSDVNSKRYYRFLIKFLSRFYWSRTIVKSKEMFNKLGVKKVVILPNGVDFERFKPMDKKRALKKTLWDANKKHILFASSPKRPEKNFKLAEAAFQLIEDNTIELHCLENIKNYDVPFYHNAADVVLLTSKNEGSPNVIKEAMACNIPIVSTDVGDVRQVIENTNACFIAKNTADDISGKLKKALQYESNTNGRNNITHLNSEIIASKLVNTYKSIVK